MRIIYNLFIKLYVAAIHIAAIFSEKARKWKNGRKHFFAELEKKIDKNSKYVWFHASSLGEFEQGRPVIEAFRKKYPQYKILLTFFSPSGYEVRKNYDRADAIIYLPADTRKNALKFLKIVNPHLVFFIKYEFWHNYIREIAEKNIPLFFFSVRFRPQQYFFKWYGKWFLKNLKRINWFFVQDENSVKLLQSVGITNVTLSGDTRFDRVWEAAQQKKQFPLVEEFSKNNSTIIAGSTWPVDEEMLIKFINTYHNQVKYIIAPHEIHPERIENFRSKLNKTSLKFSEAQRENIEGVSVLIVDSIGILLHLYQYAALAYIGGGFGKSIHNILEAATFGVPVIFGPNYHKFQEAHDLIRKGGAIAIHNYDEFFNAMDKMLGNPAMLTHSAEVCREYVAQNTGATKKILEKINSIIA